MAENTSNYTEENKSRSKSKKGDPKRVCVCAETHEKLRIYAFVHNRSMQAVVEELVDQLPD